MNLSILSVQVRSHFDTRGLGLWTRDRGRDKTNHSSPTKRVFFYQWVEVTQRTMIIFNYTHYISEENKAHGTSFNCFIWWIYQMVLRSSGAKRQAFLDELIASHQYSEQAIWLTHISPLKIGCFSACREGQRSECVALRVLTYGGKFGTNQLPYCTCNAIFISYCSKPSNLSTTFPWIPGIKCEYVSRVVHCSITNFQILCF